MRMGTGSRLNEELGKKLAGAQTDALGGQVSLFQSGRGNVAGRDARQSVDD